MKKSTVVLLSLLILVSLGACSHSNPLTEESQTSQAGTESSNEASGASTESESEEGETPLFDAGWTSNPFEALLPRLPFTGWAVTEETDRSYKAEVGGLKTNTSTGVAEDAADKLALTEYLNSLPQYGFTVKETGEGYMWLVTDKSGNTAKFMCGDGYCFLTITTVNPVAMQ